MAAIILAAGGSARFGDANKLLQPFRGAPLIDHTLRLVADNPFAERVIVTAGAANGAADRTAAFNIRCVVNARHNDGIGASIAAGVTAIGNDIHAAAIFLGDMPLIRQDTLSQMVSEFERIDGNKILRPQFGGAPGHPVIFPQRFFPALRQLNGDKGAGGIISGSAGDLQLLDVNDPGCVVDLDTPDAFSAHDD